MLAWLTCTLLFNASAQAAEPAVLPDAAATQTYARSLLAAFPEDGPGAAVLVARGSEVLVREARGRASIELAVPLDPGQRFRIGSVTKQFAAAALLKLVDAGKVKLDDPLSRFLPDYPAAEGIRVRQLLDHTAGIPNYTDIPGYFTEAVRADRDTAGMIAVFKDRPVDFAPGERWNYSNSGYVLVGAVIEQASGQPWYTVVEQSLLRPLDLAHTSYGGSDQVQVGMVNGYSPGAQVYQPAAPLSMTQPHAAGALLSTVDDLHRWNRALHGGKVLSAESYKAMITPAGAAAERQYGLGIATGSLRGQTLLSHTGGINGFVSYLGYAPESELSVVVLRNSDGATPYTPEDLARRLAAFALGKPFPEARAVTLDAAALAAASGVYRIDKDNTRTVRVDGKQLVAQRSGGAPAVLIPLGEDRFQYPNGLAMFTLERDAAGKVVAMQFWQNGEGEDKPERAERTGDVPPERQPLKLPKDALERYVGEYSGDALSFTVAWTADGSGITVQVPGQPPFVLNASAADTFFLKEVDASVRFAPAEGPVQTATLTQGPAVIELKRKP